MLLFIDCCNAFDSICQVQVILILSDIVFLKHLVVLREALYKDHSPVIRWNELRSSTFKIEGGVTESCILSQHIFNLFH